MRVARLETFRARWTSRRPARPESGLGPGVVLLGSVWPGGSGQLFDGAVVIGPDGRIEYLGPVSAARLPPYDVLGGPGSWIGPGVVDACVELAGLPPDGLVATGLVGVRDLGTAAGTARRWRTGHRRPPPGSPVVAVSGPHLVGPAHPPGQDGIPVPAPAAARAIVQSIATGGADVVSIRLDATAPRAARPDPAVVRAVVEAAHAAGLPVVARAGGVETVRRALDAGVDELAGVPAARLDEDTVHRLARTGVRVVSMLQAPFSAGAGRDAAANAADLVAAGVPLVYGSGTGGIGGPRGPVRPGVDPRELDRLADAGLGRLGALRAATAGSAGCAGMRRRTGTLRVGDLAALVVLPGDPLEEPGVWRAPAAVLADGRLYRHTPPAGD